MGAFLREVFETYKVDGTGFSITDGVSRQRIVFRPFDGSGGSLGA